jgi:MoaA/NifB/PqqE/SkfB family radical SAM enzyme
MGNSVFIHESALTRRKDFTFEQVDAKYPPTWNHERDTPDGVLKSFDKVLLRLESTNHCNFACTFCPHPTMTREKGFMDEDMVYSMLTEAGQMGFKMLDLRNFGEPLMDRRLADFAKHARQSGFSKIYIHTNGHPLTKARLDAWGEAGITDVNLSLSPKGEFAQTRPGIPVDKFFANIEKLVADKPEHMNILSVDYIRTGMSTPEQEKEFVDWLINLGIPKRIDIELHNWAVGEDDSHYRCHRLWSSVTVLWNGLVSLCCLDYDGDYILGDMNNTSLKELINSEVYVNIRKNHAEGKFLAKCATCDMPKQKDLG